MARSAISLNEPKRTLIKTIEQLSHRRRTWEVFRDFTEMSALAISNSVDLVHREAREARYMQIVANYDREEANQIAFALACVVEFLEAGIGDCLGEVFMQMELASHWHGQYFSRWPICSLMARLHSGDGFEQLTNGLRPFVTVMDPAAGSGAMLLAFAEAMAEAKLNYQQQMHATAIDIDITAVHMAYIQLSLCHIPAIVTHGNSLSLETWSTWRTPAHILGLWDQKLERRLRKSAAIAVAAMDAHSAAATPVAPSAGHHPADITIASQLALL